VVLITLTSVRIARLKSLRSLRPHRSSQIKRDARSSSTMVHPLASSGETFFYLRVPFIAFDHEVEKLMTSGIQQERGFQITQAFWPAIQAVFAHPKHPANRIDPQPFVERLHDLYDA
jgi:hypothetical protein